MSFYAGARERLLYLSFGARFSPPPGLVPGRVVAPDVTVSARTAEGRPTRGIMLTLMKPETGGLDPLAGGFTVTIYRATTVGAWAVYRAFTGVQYLDQLITYDVPGGSGLLFTVTNATGAPGIIAMAEIG